MIGKQKMIPGLQTRGCCSQLTLHWQCNCQITYWFIPYKKIHDIPVIDKNAKYIWVCRVFDIVQEQTWSDDQNLFFGVGVWKASGVCAKLLIFFFGGGGLLCKYCYCFCTIYQYFPNSWLNVHHSIDFWPL